MKKIIEILNNYRKNRAFIELTIELILLIFISFTIFILIVFFENIFFIEQYLRAKIILFFISIVFIVLTYIISKFFINYFGMLNHRNQYLIARELGDKFESIKDQLLNVLQINVANKNSDLTKVATERIYKKVSKLFNNDFSFKLPRYFKTIFLFITIYIGLLIINPAYKKASSRLLNYKQHFEPPTPFILTSLNNNIKGLSGDSIKVNIVGVGHIPDSINFYWIQDNITNRKKIKHTKEVFTNQFNNIQSDIIYWADYKTNKIFSSWNSIESNKDTITIKNRPKIKSIKFIINAPEYTNLDSIQTSLKNINQINIIKGSEITIKGKANKNLDSAWMLDKNKNERINVSTINNKFNKKLILNDDFLFSIYILDKELIPNLNPKQYYLIRNLDIPPTINIQSPNTEFNIDETMIIPIIANINDDFGLTEIFIEYQIISEDFPDINNTISKYIINNQFISNSYNLNINWDIKEIPISMGDELHFKIVATDNNAIDGFQKTISNTLIGKFPSLESLFSEIESIEDNTIDILDEIESSIDDISDITKTIKNELLKSEEVNWEQNEKINNSFEEINEISSQIEKIQENINDIIEKASSNQLFDNDLMEKFEKFQELISDIISEELLESIAELQDALDSMDMDDISEALENFDFNMEQFEEQLDRYLEMFEIAMIEQKLNELSEQAENMIDKQIDYIDDLNNNQDNYVLERKAIKQKNRFSDFEKLLNEVSDATKNQSTKVSNQLSDLINDTITKETNDSINQQAQDIKNKNNSNVLQKNLEDIKEMVDTIKNEFQNEISKQLTKEFIQIIDNLITISNQQEELIIQSKHIRSNSPNIQKINRQQFNIDRQFNKITQQLIDLSQSTFYVNPKINRLIGKVKTTISNIISDFEQKVTSKAKKNQLKSLEYINEITYLLLLSMEEMQSSNAVSGFEKFMESLEKMSDSQKGINEGTMQLGQMGMMQQQSLMEQLMQQQAQLKKQLQDMISDNPGQNTGGLSAAQDEMEEVLSDFKLKNITKETIERQQSILSKMLDTQKSLTQRDFSNKRNSKTADTKFENLNYNKIPNDYGEKNLFYISAMENALKDNQNDSYNDMIRLYFLNLQKESLNNEK